MIKIIKYYKYNLITLTHTIQCLFDHMLVNSLIYNKSLPITTFVFFFNWKIELQMPMESWSLDLGAWNWGARDKMECIQPAQMVWALGNTKEKPKVLHSCFFPKFGNCNSNIYSELKTDIYHLQITIVSICGGEEWVRL